MQWDAIWIGAHLATMRECGDAYGAIRDGALAVANGRIAWVGPEAALPAAPTALSPVVHDCAGRWITPGLVDSHTHLVSAGNRSMDFEMRLQGADRPAIYAAGGGIPATVLKTRAASEDELLASTLHRLDALQREGVTTVEIKSGYGLDLETELKQLRVARRVGELRRATVVTAFLGMHGLPPGYEGSADDYAEFVCRTSLPEAIAAGLVDIVDGALERICFDGAQTARVWRVAQAHGKPVKAHADQYADAGGATVVAAFGGLSADHLECISPAGIDAMAQAGTVATLLPGANYMLDDRNRPPVDAFRKAGVRMAVATNANPGSSPTLSPLLMMNMACRRFGLTTEEALAGFTREGARALGQLAERGTLEVGKAADFAEWDIERPAELAYWLGTGLQCHRLVKDGAVVLDHGRSLRLSSKP